MLIKGTDYSERRRAKRRVASSGTFDKTPGKHYAIVNVAPTAQTTEHVVDGQPIRLVNNVGFTEDRDFAAAIAAQGKGRLVVKEREKHFATGRSFFTVPEMPWRKKETVRESRAEDQGRSEASEAIAPAGD